MRIGTESIGRISLRFAGTLFLNLAAWIVFLLLLLAFNFVWLRDYQMNWGASDETVSRPMPGDALLEDPEMNATRAVIVETPPERIWPWIVQIGSGRGGFYGFDRLDNRGAPSAERILPEYQDLKVGDAIIAVEHEGETYHIIEVAEIDPGRSMLWVFGRSAGPWSNATWSWGLYPVDGNRTEVVSRLRQKYTLGSFREIVLWSVMDTIEILMMRTTLLGIKKRAESM